MEGSLNQISVQFPRMISDAEAKVKLRDRLFYGVLKTLRDSIRYLYDNPTVRYTQLLVAVRKAEAKVSNGKLGTMIIKAKAATANDELVSLKQQVSDLVAVVKAKHVLGNPKGTTQQNGPKMEIKQIEESTYLGELLNSLVLLDHPKIINQCDSAIITRNGATWQKSMPHL